MRNKPKVSVVLLVYNHAQYLDQAIQSIIDQEVNFEYELVVIDDFSTDKSREIILAYKNKYPELIRLYFHKKNYGAIISSRERFSIANGEYICLLEGDDYWCDKDKLQAQVDILDKDPTLVGCTHNTMISDDSREETAYICSESQGSMTTGLDDLIDGKYYFHTSSYLWRNIFKPRSPWPHYNTLSGDWILSMMYACHGNIRYINKVMSVYRIHSDGAWSKLSSEDQLLKNLEQLAFINAVFMFKYNTSISRIWWPVTDLHKHFSNADDTRNYKISLQLFFLMRSLDVEDNRYTHSYSLSKTANRMNAVKAKYKRKFFCALYYISKGFYLSHFSPLYRVLLMRLFRINTFEIYNG